jgi:hypothetical protein
MEDAQVLLSGASSMAVIAAMCSMVTGAAVRPR